MRPWENEGAALLLCYWLEGVVGGMLRLALTGLSKLADRLNSPVGHYEENCSGGNEIPTDYLI